MAPAMPCKTSKKSKHGETRGKCNEIKSKLACILEARESTRMRMEEPLPKYLEDHIVGKGDNSLQHYNLVHKFIPMPQAMKIPAAKAAVDKEWENLKRSGRATWQKSEVNQRRSMKQGRKAQKFILPHWWTSVIWRMPNWRQSTKNTKVELYFEETSWKMILDLMQYSLNRDHQHLKWQQQKSWMSYPDCQGAQDKQLAVSAKTQVKTEEKFQNRKCPDIWIRLPRHKWPKSWSSMEDPVVPLERNLCGHPLAALLRERQLGLGEGFKLDHEKGLFLSAYVDDIKLAGKKQNINPMWKVLNKEVDLGEPTYFLDHVFLVCTQRQCEISKDIVDN